MTMPWINLPADSKSILDKISIKLILYKVLLNASNPNVNFKYSVDDIIWKVRTAYATGMYQLYADCLHIENNRGGDIATGNQTPDRVEEIRLELTKQLTKKFFVRNVAPTLVIFITIVQQVDKDRWTNVKLSQPKPGQFFNRRSCSWYWNSKRKDATLLQGLVAFAKEDYETAEKHWNLLAELDKEFYAQQKAAGWENATTFARLTWNLRNQKGSLYATPEEMASFKDPKRRMAILIADLYYESEQHQKALSVYQRLENRELGTLSKNELAYVTLGVFSCLCWDKKFDETAYLFHKAKLFEGTPSEARAYFYYGNRISRIGGLEGYKFSIRAYETCIQKYPNSKEANNARLFLAEKYKDLGDLLILSKNLDEAKRCYSFASKYYQDYRKLNNETIIIAQIERILKDLERKNLLNK